jgi:superfamily II DNA or RNA helicase
MGSGGAVTVLFDHQSDFVDDITAETFPQRACVYFKTGAGKSLTAVMGLHALGQAKAVVISPPSTHAQWLALGDQYGMELQVMSHAKFRMKDTRLSRTVAVVADEFHLLGGQHGKGWRKLDTIAKHLQAPLFIMSATPQYNDAERCYCIQHIIDPSSCKGGFLEFLYRHCETEQNPFSQTPYVTGFKMFPDAAAYLASLPRVHYLPDDLVYTIEDREYPVTVPQALTEYSYNERDDRMVASIIEMMHTVRLQGLIAPDGRLRDDVWTQVFDVIQSHDRVLIFAQHSTVIDALAFTMMEEGLDCFDEVTGSATTKQKTHIIKQFIKGEFPVLLGTAALATGTDGLDRVCDTLLILDDTDDDALRRQLIGRIMPRGLSVDASMKRVIRLVPAVS